MNSEATMPSLYAISGTAPDDVWAVGWDGSILHWDGESWSHTKTGTDKPLGGVCAVARDDAWVFGMGGALLHWNGETWTRHLAPAAASFWRAWANSSDDVWAIVQPRSMARWDGESWTGIRLEDSDSGSDLGFGEQSKLLGVWGSGPNDVWLVGSQIIRWDGKRFESHATPEVYGALEGVWGFGPRDVWAVGSHGMVARFDGDSWRRLPVPGEPSLTAVWGSGPSDVWIAGERGVLGYWDGKGWSFEVFPGEPNIMALWGATADEVWAVCITGQILRRAGGAWMVVAGHDWDAPEQIS